MESIFWLDSIWRRYSIFCVLEHFEADFTRQNDHFKECLAAATKLHFFGIFFSEASLNIKRNILKGGAYFFLTSYLLLNRASVTDLPWASVAWVISKDWCRQTQMKYWCMDMGIFRSLAQKYICTGWSDGLGLRNRAAVSLFWDLWCAWRLLCHPKTGRKFPLGQKHYLICLTMRQEDG